MYRIDKITNEVFGFSKDGIPQECPEHGKRCSNKCPFFDIFERDRKKKIRLSCKLNAITIIIDEEVI